MRLEYRVVGVGWAEATVSSGDLSADLTACYLSDPLGSLLGAVLSISGGAERAQGHWCEEPGEFRWLFDRDDGAVRVRVLSFTEDEELPESAGREIFATTEPFVEVAAAIADGIQKVLEEHGEDGYFDLWSPIRFPTDQLSDLQRLLAENA